MSKKAEIEYVARMATALNTTAEEVENWLTSKPYPDPNRHSYFLDLGQLMKLLPPAPARLLDLGVGPGWTSDILARCGYSVLGLDIAPDMIELARRRLDPSLDLRFEVHDYEESIPEEGFDVVVIYDALHHAVDEGRVIANALACLKPGGVFITLEPGAGHSKTPGAIETIEKFGTTEKDMDYTHQAALMRKAGFSQVRHYLRLSQLPLESVHDKAGQDKQWAHVNALWEGTLRHGSSCVVVAVK